MNNLIKAFQMVVTNYVGFTGRATRSEFWYFILTYIIIYFILAILEGLVGLTGILTGIFGLAMLLPSLAVEFRRLHDTGRTAWWLLIGLIPLVGLIVLIYFWAQPSQEGDNEHGPKPTF
jgi:uncharacterized membrane protein YhaH (DUF805 family)